MDYGIPVTIAQRLAIEKQLLREEKFIVQALKAVKEERYGLQREGTDMLCLLQKVLKSGKPNTHGGEEAQVAEPAAVSSSSPQPETQPLPSQAKTLPDDFDFVLLNDTVGNDIELNLTVPTHPYYGKNAPQEDLEEMETEDEDDFEIEMSMLMNGQIK